MDLTKSTITNTRKATNRVETSANCGIMVFSLWGDIIDSAHLVGWPSPLYCNRAGIFVSQTMTANHGVISG